MLIRTNYADIATGGLVAAIFASTSANIGFYIASPETLSSDRRIVLALIMAVVFCGLFSGGHFLLRRLGLSHRLLYSLCGAVAMTVALMAFADSSEREAMIRSGAIISTLVFPAAAGWILGSFYHWHAGYEVDGDDIDALDKAVQHSITAAVPDKNDPEASAPQTDGDASYVRTATAEYFSGPTQVRSSLNATVISAICATLISSITMWFFLFAGHYSMNPNDLRRTLTGDPFRPGSPKVDYSVMTDALASIMQSGLMMSALLAIPVSLLIYALHLILRAFRKSSFLHYGLAGLAMPIIVGAVFIVALPVGIRLAIPFAIAMLLYRRLAGLEPLALPDDMLVSDRRTLISAEHARRRFARVIDRS